MLDESEFQDVLRRFDGLDRCLVDSSSIIYMGKAGFLSVLSSTLDLATIPEVAEEVGNEAIEGITIEILPAPGGSASTDRRLVDAAVELAVPILSEDRKLLLEADRRGLDYYNALMMVGLLERRSVLSAEAAEAVVEKLLLVAHYSRRVRSYVRDLQLFIRKGL